jgi:pSer/pThr/pTyr-binding forkhead associated (FHA) protein
MSNPPLALSWRRNDVTHRIALADGPLVLGRDPACDVVLDNLSVSRRHAQIGRDGDRFVLRALSRTSPTRLNGRVVVRDAALSAGDVVELAMVRLDVVAMLDDEQDDGDPNGIASDGDGRSNR